MPGHPLPKWGLGEFANCLVFKAFCRLRSRPAARANAPFPGGMLQGRNSPSPGPLLEDAHVAVVKKLHPMYLCCPVVGHLWDVPLPCVLASLSKLLRGLQKKLVDSWGISTRRDVRRPKAGNGLRFCCSYALYCLAEAVGPVLRTGRWLK